MDSNLIPIKEIYKDFAQPTVKNVGNFLDAATGMVFIPLTDLCRKNTKRFLEKVSDKIEKIPEEHRVVPKIDIVVPILQKAHYVSEGKIRELYTDLLAKACDQRLQNKVLPSYISVIEKLHPRDVEILDKLRQGVSISVGLSDVIHNLQFSLYDSQFGIPFLSIKARSNESRFQHVNQEYFSNMKDNFNNFDHDSFGIHLSNLVFCDILEIPLNERLYDDDFYTGIEQEAKREYTQQYVDAKRYGNPGEYVLETERKCIKLTIFGKSFLDLIYRDN